MFLAGLGAILAAGGRQHGNWLVFVSIAGLYLLATPMVANGLQYSIEQALPEQLPGGPPPQAIIILGGDRARNLNGQDVGHFSLERVRAGAALARRTGLPLLVTGGAISRPEDQPVAVLMARSLADDFAMAPRWVEPAARDTHQNAVLSVAMLRAAGITSAYVVSHAWHLPRALEAFARLGFVAVPAPVALAAPPPFELRSLLPRPDYWGVSWYAMREWVGRLVYGLRDNIDAGH
jgi:uncharacterized SAM-binding protein YcdF (DUF218 family)